MVKASNIHRESAWCGVFSVCLLGARENVGHQYGILARLDLKTQKQVRKTCGDDVISVIADHFTI